MPEATIDRTAAIAEPLSKEEIETWNEEFAGISPEERITIAHRRLGGQLIAATSFGPSAPVLLNTLSEVSPETPVVNVRTHHETLRTLKLSKWYAEELELNLHTYDAPALPLPHFGSPAFAEFQQRVKVEPFRQALEDLQPLAYLSGRMRWQSPERADIPFVEQRGDVAVISPIADLARYTVEKFFEDTGWPRDEDYFDPTKGPDQQTECGLNTANYEFNKEVENAKTSNQVCQ